LPQLLLKRGNLTPQLSDVGPVLRGDFLQILNFCTNFLPCDTSNFRLE
jgi:hypothetical protein